jgi:hypothetical protein
MDSLLPRGHFLGGKRVLVMCALKDAAEVESRGFGERVFVEFPNRLC